MNNYKTEILIIGGGIAGCIAAISLADSFKVTVVDKLALPADKVGESLAPAAQRILNKLQLLPDEETQKSLFINNLGMQSYWGNDSVQIVDHLRNPDGFPKSLDRKKFEIYLRDKAIEKGVTCCWGLRFFNSVFENNLWKITCKSDDLKNRTTTIFNADFVIDATGRSAHFAKSLQIKRTSLDTLISCWITLPNKEENAMSTIVSDKNGWWYTAVLPNNQRVLSYQTDADLFEKSIFKNIDSFLELIKKNKRIYSYVEKAIDQLQFHGTVSANSTKLDKVAGKQWLALGDAAISFDPLSSQGMFNAMACAMQVTELLKHFNFIKEYDIAKVYRFSEMYTSQINSIWKHYVKHKDLLYGAESRWKDAAFWKRRQVGVLKNEFAL